MGQPLRRAKLRRRRDNQSVYWVRRLIIIAVLLGAAGLAYAGVKWGGFGAAKESEPDLTPNFEAAYTLQTADVNDDGLPDSLWVSAPSGGERQVALVVGEGKGARQVGEPVTVPDLPLAVVDLPSRSNVLLVKQTRPTAGEVETVPVGNATAKQAAGGEPIYLAWAIHPERGLETMNFALNAAPPPPADAQTAIIVDVFLNTLWYYENGKLERTAMVATGRHIEGPYPTWENQAINFLTPLGTYAIGSKEADPIYYAQNLPGGHPDNPLGTRWIGFSVMDGDNASVWGIHGTNEPHLVGQWASDGCIRLTNADVEWLYDRVEIGTPLIIMSSRGMW